MTWNPHLMKVLYTINYPLINGGGLQGFQNQNLRERSLMVPLPMYQTGVMLTLDMGPAKLMAGSFNGSEIVGGADLNDINVLGNSNVMDLEKTKGGLVKLAMDQEGMHFGVWYYGEEAAVRVESDERPPGAPGPPPTDPGGAVRNADAAIEQKGVELALTSDALIMQAQYLQTILDFNDPDGKSRLGGNLHELYQEGWYVLLGANMGDGAQAVCRYDYMDYDNKKVIVLDGRDSEGALTFGLNYLINENTTMGVNYTHRWIEDWHASPHEWSFIMETNLF